MSTGLPVYPFDAQMCVGTLSEVGPSFAKANLPHAAAPEGRWHHGRRYGLGEVGEFVIVECGQFGILGRLVSVKLPERERLTVEPELGGDREAHPLGTIQLLSTLSIESGKVTPGMTQYPRLGSRVYVAHPSLLKWVAETSQRASTETEQDLNPLLLDVAALPSANDTAINLTPEHVFGRHCAVLGATGGGKSWSLARLIEQAARHHAKLILFDATGEFHTLTCGVRHVYLGQGVAQPASGHEVVFPYTELTESDLLALFRPSGLSQAPKLRAAMKSLKLARVAPTEIPQLLNDGVVVKANEQKHSFESAYARHAAVVEAPRADFEVGCLTRQIAEECVYPTDFKDATCWGKRNDAEFSYCVSLITRIQDIVTSGDLACLFQPTGRPSLVDEMESFLTDPDERVLRISLKHTPFAHDAREITANAIGRHLLTLGRTGKFRNLPVVVFLDEAHQFLNKSLGDENTRYRLDAFELIAKEGRKFSLSICIATQRPRDIPEGVLSQMGTLLVHRLINDRDREVVERASGDIDKSAAAFLPTLAPGQAIVIGVDFPIPLTVQMFKPSAKPDSRGPDYQTHWRAVQPSDQKSSAMAAG